MYSKQPQIYLGPWDNTQMDKSIQLIVIKNLPNLSGKKTFLPAYYLM
jgi:hypothetical protein